jgi:membrane dipeptidase
MFYKLGVRYMTLTHNGGPSWADPALSLTGQFLQEAPNGGLTPFGCDVVYEMNRLGMLVDLSHVHHDTMKKALECSRAPVIFSHSSSRALCNHPRDVPDDVLQLLVANGGVIMVTFVSDFVAGQFWVRGGKAGATVIEVVDHIDHIKRVTGGVDNIGIGGDYDGASDLPRGLEDVGRYHNLTAELLYRGYSDEDILKILSGNTMRVLEAAERVRDEMQANPQSLPCESINPVADADAKAL